MYLAAVNAAQRIYIYPNFVFGFILGQYTHVDFMRLRNTVKKLNELYSNKQ